MTFAEMMKLDQEVKDPPPLPGKKPVDRLPGQKPKPAPMREPSEARVKKKRGNNSRTAPPRSFRPSKAEPAKQPRVDRFSAKPRITERKSVRSSVRKSEPAEHRTGLSPFSLPLKRGTKRYSFEFYVDQLERLRRIKIEEGLQGRNLYLSDIVRIALDEYLDKIGL